nr:RHS repeat-associated core domain-containing protein [Boseongicola sp. H5]
MAVSVSTGAVAAEYDYDSFGQRTLVQGTEEVRYGFTAREHDARTGLIHYRARAYDPLTGRFLQRDPIGFASGDLNLYAYVENDPYNWTDPSGLTPSAGTAVGIQRDSAIRGALSPVFSGVLGFAQRLANAMRGYQSIAGTASAVMNQIADGGSGEGDDRAGQEEGKSDPIDTGLSDPNRPIGVIHNPDGTREVVWSDGNPTPLGTETRQPSGPQPEPPEQPWWARLIRVLFGGLDE